MKNVTKKNIDNFIQACSRVASHKLARCSSGNFSLRIDDDRFLVTSSRSWISKITPEDISLCLISDGSLLEGRKPSVETDFHAGILKARQEMNAVLHFQTPYATALACMESNNTNYFVIPEIPFYIGNVANIPYFTPGSKELAEAVTEKMQNHDMLVMRNHGQVTVAHDIDHVIQNAVFFELACEIILCSDRKAKPLSAENVHELFELKKMSIANE